MLNNKVNSKPISIRNFIVNDSFWKEKMDLVRKEVIPYQWEILNDRIEGANPSYCMRNFEMAGKLNRNEIEMPKADEVDKNFRGVEVWPEDKDNLQDAFYGFVFQDSDFYKWIEAVAYTLATNKDEKLEEIADKAIDIVCEAQLENGYLDTFYIIGRMDRIFTDLRFNHELYCFGHLLEGAVAYYEATGKDKLLKASIKYADFIYDKFGYGEGKCKGYPGHEIAEMALIRLYEVTKEKRYLELSSYFISQRGQKPNYFDIELGIEEDGKERHQYHQAHKPVVEQDEAVGHAVRAVYLYSGMVDNVKYTGEQKLWSACEKLWNSTVNKQMYITGAIGSTSIGEAFSFQYDLPNDLAYAETCASIGLIFWARRMLEVNVDSKYSDVIERALYNTVLSGMALDGKSFFYVNPLEVNPEACEKDERKHHVKAVRQKWFGCACCPPNVARLLSSLSTYAYGENENSIFVHLHIGGTLKKEINGVECEFEIKSNIPWSGEIEFVSKNKIDKEFTVALRVPSWAKDFDIPNNPTKECFIKNGYLYIKGLWEEGESISLNFEMSARLIMSNSNVRENIGKVAVVRGPIVYCLEEYDNGNNLHKIELHGETSFKDLEVEICGEKFGSIVVEGRRIVSDLENSLYSEYKQNKYEDTNLVLIPYFTWANRGENEMQVWTKVY